MADPYYYQDNNGQVFGPLTPSALKHLANEGVIHEATPVRKGEQGAWYQAGTIAGLVTSARRKRRTSRPPSKTPRSTAKRHIPQSRRTCRQGRGQALVPRSEVQSLLHAKTYRRYGHCYCA